MKIIEKKIIRIFKKILKIKNTNKKKELTQKKIKNWDSLNHVLLLLAIQEEFKIKFKISEYSKLDTFQNILKIITNKKKTLFEKI